nr:hypothetical protein [Deltaproteobacteria bacterium]
PLVSAIKPRELAALFPPDHPDRQLEESSRAREEAELDGEYDRDAIQAKRDEP